MADIDRTFDGAIREIHHLCAVIEDLKRDNKILQEMLVSVIKERNESRKQMLDKPWEDKNRIKWTKVK